MSPLSTALTASRLHFGHSDCIDRGTPSGSLERSALVGIGPAAHAGVGLLLWGNARCRSRQMRSCVRGTGQQGEARELLCTLHRAHSFPCAWVADWGWRPFGPTSSEDNLE